MARPKATEPKRVVRTLADGTTQVYFYDRASGRRVDQTAPARDPAFTPKPPAFVPAWPAGSVGALYADYDRWPVFRRLNGETQKSWRRLLERYLGELFPISAGDVPHMGLQAILDAVVGAGHLGTAHALRSAMRGMFKFGAKTGVAQHSPANGLSLPPMPVRRPWRDDQLERWFAIAPTFIRRAMQLALWTGQRQHDLFRVQWSQLRDGRLHLDPSKITRHKASDVLDEDGHAVPLSPEAIAELAKWKRTSSAPTILAGPSGRPITGKSFRSHWAQFRLDAMRRDPSLPKPPVFHALRHTVASRIIEETGSAHAAMAITGHRSVATLQRYVAMAEQRKRAERGAQALWAALPPTAMGAKPAKKKLRLAV